MTINRVPVDLHTVIGARQLSKKEAGYFSGDIERRIDDLTDSILVEIRAQVFVRGERIEISSEEVPLTWWDHVRQRYFPSWVNKRWPIRTRRIATKTEVLVPVSMDDQQYAVNEFGYCDAAADQHLNDRERDEQRSGYSPAE